MVEEKHRVTNYNFLHFLSVLGLTHKLYYYGSNTKSRSFTLKNPQNEHKITSQNIFFNIIEMLSTILILIILMDSITIDVTYETLNVISKYFMSSRSELIILLLWKNENIFAWGIGFGCVSENIDQGRSFINMNVNISNCFFSRSSVYSGNGGVIFVNGDDYSVDISYSMFFSCICTNQAGAIYFESTNSCLRMICANRCSCGASYYCQFAYLRASKVNQLDYQSVSYCSHVTSGNRPVFLHSGNQKISNMNSSMNYAIRFSGILIESPSSFTGSHCTFSNSKVSDSICIHIYSSSVTISISFSNIVHNNSPNYGVVFVEGAGQKKMLYCIFQNNQNYLFYVQSGSLEVSHSFIGHSSSQISTSTVVSTSTNNSNINRMTYQIQFFNSHHCNADIPINYVLTQQMVKRWNISMVFSLFIINPIIMPLI